MSYNYSNEELVIDYQELIHKGTSPGYEKIKQNYEKCLTFNIEGIPKDFRSYFQFNKAQLVTKYKDFEILTSKSMTRYNDLMISSESVENVMDFIDRVRNFLLVKGESEK